MAIKAPFIAELDLKFFAKYEFESIDNPGAIARNALRVLMMGWTRDWKKLQTLEIAKAVFYKRDPVLLKHMRHAFQEGFNYLFTQLENKSFNAAQNEQVQLYLSNCLSVLPFSDLTHYESIKIPQLVDNKWELVEYTVSPIELTPPGTRDQDRVFAYGLTPLLQKNTQSHLIFMGTTYPAGQGFMTQLNTDTKGFSAVGEDLYRTGRLKIQKWLAKQNYQTHVCGMSLGGSLSLLLSLDRCVGYKLSRVDALNPAGLHDGGAKLDFDHWDQLTADEKPQVVVQKQGNDPVSCFGVWKEDWEILEVTPPEDKKGPNPFIDHALNYAGLIGALFKYVDAKEDNAKRVRRNFWLFSIGRAFIYYGLFAPLNWVVRPVGLFLAQNWPLLALVPFVSFAIHCAVISFPLAIAVIALAVTIASVFQLLQKQPEPPSFARMHDPKLPRNEDMDIYAESNAINIPLTYKEINTYYKVTRSSKDKEFLPTDKDRPSKHVRGMTKHALLEASENPEKQDEVVSFHVTKAKAVHIYETLSFVHRLGLENKERLNSELRVDYADYALGKHPKL